LAHLVCSPAVQGPFDLVLEQDNSSSFIFIHILQQPTNVFPSPLGWKIIRVGPEPGGGITSAKSAYKSPYGWVNVTWEVTDGFKLEVSVPPNTRAHVVLPSLEVHEVGSGKSSFEVPGFVLPE